MQSSRGHLAQVLQWHGTGVSSNITLVIVIDFLCLGRLACNCQVLRAFRRGASRTAGTDPEVLVEMNDILLHLEAMSSCCEACMRPRSPSRIQVDTSHLEISLNLQIMVLQLLYTASEHRKRWRRQAAAAKARSSAHSDSTHPCSELWQVQ